MSSPHLTSVPTRIQLRRTAGWRKPPNTIVVARPTVWGNPWQIVAVRDNHFPFTDAADVIHATSGNSAGRFRRTRTHPDDLDAHYWAVQHYRLHLADHPEIIERARTELRGHHLACWCPTDVDCHADVLLDVANAATSVLSPLHRDRGPDRNPPT